MVFLSDCHRTIYKGNVKEDRYSKSLRGILQKALTLLDDGDATPVVQSNAVDVAIERPSKLQRTQEENLGPESFAAYISELPGGAFT